MYQPERAVHHRMNTPRQTEGTDSAAETAELPIDYHALIEQALNSGRQFRLALPGTKIELSMPTDMATTLPVFVLDDQLNRFIQTNMYEVVRELPELLSARRRMRSADVVTKKNIEMIVQFDPMHTFTESDLEVAQVLDESVWSEWKTTQEMLIAIRTIPEELKKVSRDNKRRCTFQDIDAFWPAEVLPQVKEKLSLVERYWLKEALIAGSMSEINENYDSTVSHNKEYATEVRSSRAIREFIMQHRALFTNEILTSLSEKIEYRLTREEIDSVLLRCIASREMKQYLIELGIESPVAVISKRREPTCPATEPRLMSELREHGACVVRIVFPDKTYALLAIKYTEITVGACVSSNNSLFREGMSYLPVGETFTWVDHLVRGTYQTVELSDQEACAQVWAKNRWLDEYSFKKIQQAVRVFIGQDVPDDDPEKEYILPKFQSHHRA